jgi:hypothetical protein
MPQSHVDSAMQHWPPPPDPPGGWTPPRLVEAIRAEARAEAATDGILNATGGNVTHPAEARDRGFNHTGPCIYMCGTCGEPPPAGIDVER